MLRRLRRRRASARVGRTLADHASIVIALNGQVVARLSLGQLGEWAQELSTQHGQPTPTTQARPVVVTTGLSVYMEYEPGDSPPCPSARVTKDSPGAMLRRGAGHSARPTPRPPAGLQHTRKGHQ